MIEPVSIAGFRRILHVLFRIGSAISRRLVQKAETAVKTGASWREASVAYARVARAIRRIIMLALEIAEPGYGETKDPERDGSERGERLEGLDRPDWYDEPERPDRKDKPDAPYDLTNKGMDGVIQEICRDLGLPPLDTAHPWTSLTVEEIAKLVLDAVASLLGETAVPSSDGVGWRSASPPPVRDEPGLSPRVPDG